MMTMRLIDADALLEKFNRNSDIPTALFDSDTCKAFLIFCKVADAIDSLPIIDAEPVRHGRYIGTEYDGYADGNPVFYEWICSECECVFEDEKPTYKYCPNCGARMDGDGDATD